LFAFAHPDDETFTCGGSIARYADQGNTRLVLYCATRGEAGKTQGFAHRKSWETSGLKN